MKTKAENVTIYQGSSVVGWILPPGSCSNATCKKHTAAGRPYHATPRVGILEVNHFATIEEAQAALLA